MNQACLWQLQAESLAITLHDKHFPEITNWEPASDITGLLLQIDNMTSGMSVIAQSQEPSE